MITVTVQICKTALIITSTKHNYVKNPPFSNWQAQWWPYISELKYDINMIKFISVPDRANITVTWYAEKKNLKNTGCIHRWHRSTKSNDIAKNKIILQIKITIESVQIDTPRKSDHCKDHPWGYTLQQCAITSSPCPISNRRTLIFIRVCSPGSK